jgi:hypothetical protein
MNPVLRLLIYRVIGPALRERFLREYATAEPAEFARGKSIG